MDSFFMLCLLAVMILIIPRMVYLCMKWGVFGYYQGVQHYKESYHGEDQVPEERPKETRKRD